MSNINISFGLYDVTAKQDTTASATNIQPFIDPDDLKLDSVYPNAYVTPEPDFWKLDGSFFTFPNTPSTQTWGLWSNIASDISSKFVSDVVLTLDFTHNHSSVGLSFEFCPYDNTYCNDLNIKWYNKSDVLFDLNFKPDNWKYSCLQSVENYDKVIITFKGMNRPYRLLKVQNIMHGVLQEFTDDEVTACSLLETIDLTSATLEINTLSFDLISNTDEFNIFNPTGIFALLQKKQQISVSAVNDNIGYNLGTFYLSDWESSNTNEMKFSSEDCIGIMDGTYFIGNLYNKVLCNDVIEEILDDAGFGYILDSDFDNVTITGYIPRCTHREALQYVAMAIGAYIDTSRSGTIKIYTVPDFSRDSQSTIDMDRKFTGTTVKLREYITGINITTHNYTLDTTVSELYKDDNAPLGTQTILFNEPSKVSSVSGGTIISSGVNYVTVNVTSASLKVSGYKYTDNTSIVSVINDNIQAGEAENNLDISDNTLITTSNALDVATRIYNYYQYRIEQNIPMILNNEVVGMPVSVEATKDNFIAGLVEKLETDVFGDFQTKAVVLNE